MDRLEEQKGSLSKEFNVNIFLRKLDVTDRENFKSFVQEAEKEVGPIDVLVNNAGVMSFTYMKNLKEDEWNLTVDVNIKVWKIILKNTKHENNNEVMMLGSFKWSWCCFKWNVGKKKRTYC